MIPDDRLFTLVSGAALVLVAPVVAFGRRGWQGWSLGLLAWSWGWSRILISVMSEWGMLAVHLLMYVLIALPAVGLGAAAAMAWDGLRRTAAVASLAVLTIAMEAWYFADHGVLLGGDIAAHNLLYPLVIVGIGATGLAALEVASRSRGRTRETHTWLGLGLLALPAFRGIQLATSLAVAPAWGTWIGRLEAVIFGLAVAMLVYGTVRAARRLDDERVWAVGLGAMAAGGASLIVEGLLPLYPTLMLRYGLDAVAALAAAVAMLYALRLGPAGNAGTRTTSAKPANDAREPNA